MGDKREGWIYTRPIANLRRLHGPACTRARRHFGLTSDELQGPRLKANQRCSQVPAFQRFQNFMTSRRIHIGRIANRWRMNEPADSAGILFGNGRFVRETMGHMNQHPLAITG